MRGIDSNEPGGKVLQLQHNRKTRIAEPKDRPGLAVPFFLFFILLFPLSLANSQPFILTNGTGNTHLLMAFLARIFV
jgi:hypothetical protein